MLTAVVVLVDSVHVAKDSLGSVTMEGSETKLMVASGKLATQTTRKETRILDE
jgi:hypothetical protein